MTAPRILYAFGSPAGLTRSASTLVPGTSPRSSILRLVIPPARMSLTVAQLPTGRSPRLIILPAGSPFPLFLTGMAPFHIFYSCLTKLAPAKNRSRVTLAADTIFYARRSILVTGHNLARDISS